MLHDLKPHAEVKFKILQHINRVAETQWNDLLMTILPLPITELNARFIKQVITLTISWQSTLSEYTQFKT